MKKTYHTAVVIGRFQLPHVNHKKLFQEAASLAENLVIIIGSVGQPSTAKNPFSYTQRVEFITTILDTFTSAYKILPVLDQRYNLNSWVVDVANKVNDTLPPGWTDKPRKVVLVGHHSDSSSTYLDMFRQWASHEVRQYSATHSSDIRNRLYKYPSQNSLTEVPEEIRPKIQQWILSDRFRHVQEEYQSCEADKKKYGIGPFITVDAVALQSGHLLMIQRKHHPGKGLWALPGGFLDPGETLREAALRELKEETEIKLQDIILDKAITKTQVYDHPDRSSRGRNVTHCFKFDLDSSKPLPRVRGATDAREARWIPLNEVYSMGETVFEDHLDIILDITR